MKMNVFIFNEMMKIL